ncbi:MAG: TonB-dependent receptor [Bacteroidota bacterium]
MSKRYINTLSTAVMLLFTSIIPGFSQVIHGYVTDTTSGEPLVGAHLLVKDNHSGTITNDFGYYILKLSKPGIRELTISYIGYKNKEVKFKLTRDTTINFLLKPNYQQQEVRITASRPIEERNEQGLIQLPISRIEKIPMLAGETDIIKAVQMMPGVKSGAEGQSNMYVRGGSHDQNLILLDDIPLYNINHLGGFVSVFNTGAINHLKFYTGAFPARYGGRLSSIMDVRSKNGNLKKRTASITFGMVTSKLLFEGPIKKDTSSYMLSIRRFMYDLFSRPVTKLLNDGQSTGYTFYDINLRLNHKINQSNRLFFSFYMGDDAYTSQKKEKTKSTIDENKFKNNWGNLLISGKWNHVLGNNLFGDMNIYFSRYRYVSDFFFRSEEPERTHEIHYMVSSAIKDVGFKTDFEFHKSPDFNLKLGSVHVIHQYQPGVSELDQPDINFIDNTYNANKYIGIENAAYLEGEVTLRDALMLNTGMRGVHFIIDDKAYFNLEPRVSGSVAIPGLVAVNASFSRMHQYSHLLITSASGLPGDLWMPVTRNIPPQKADIISVGAVKSINKSFELSIEAYSKKMSDLIDYKDGQWIQGNDIVDWESAIEKEGVGNSKGLEVLVQKNSGLLSGWVSYTLSRTTRQFNNINQGREYIYTYDATHDFASTVQYQMNKSLSISASWVYVTGRAITLPNIFYETQRLTTTDGNHLPVDNPGYETIHVSTYNEKNNIRMHPYHRLDLGLTYQKHKKNTKRIWNFSIYNVYNRQNPYYYFTARESKLDKSGNKTGEYDLKTYQRSLFPIIPSISYTMRF